MMSASTDMQRPAKGGQHVTQPSLAAMVRDQLVLNNSLIIDVVNEVVAAMPAHTAELFRQGLSSSPSLAAAVKRCAVDIGVVLSLAKSFEDDEAFADSVGMVHDVNFSAHDGLIATFASAMVQADLDELLAAEAGKSAPDDMLLYDMVPVDVLERRLRLLAAFIAEAAKRQAR